jgi:hypothetical protein
MGSSHFNPKSSAHSTSDMSNASVRLQPLLPCSSPPLLPFFSVSSVISVVNSLPLRAKSTSHG